MNEASSNAKDDTASKARLQAFNAAQWLARIAHSYSRQDDAIELKWDMDGRRIMTPELAPGLTLGLSLPTLVLQFDENGKPSPHPINLDDKSSTELEAWILVELLHRGIDRDVFSKALPYETTGLMSGKEPKYSADELADELTKLNKAFENAAEVLLLARRKLYTSSNGSTADAPDLIFWPQRMEIGFFIEDDNGSADRRCKLGYAAGSAKDDAPRFFVGPDTKRSTELSMGQVESDKMSVDEVAGYLVDHAGGSRRPTKK